jgi:hypothetical protein
MFELDFQEFFLNEEMVAGKEIVASPEWFDTFFNYNDYIYKKNKEVKATFSPEDLRWRLGKWTLFGNIPKPGESVQEADASGVGYVMANDRGNFWKLVGSGGNLKGQVQGLDELASTGKGVFGAMEPRMASMLVKKKPEYISPPPGVIKAMYPIMTSSSDFSGGGSWEGINPDGSITYDMGGDIGRVKKGIIGTRPFFKMMIEKALSKSGINPLMLKMAKLMPGKAVKMAQSKGVDIDQESLMWLADILGTKGTPSTPVDEPMGAMNKLKGLFGK